MCTGHDCRSFSFPRFPAPWPHCKYDTCTLPNTDFFRGIPHNVTTSDGRRSVIPRYEEWEVRAGLQTTHRNRLFTRNTIGLPDYTTRTTRSSRPSTGATAAAAAAVEEEVTSNADFFCSLRAPSSVGHFHPIPSRRFTDGNRRNVSIITDCYAICSGVPDCIILKIITTRVEPVITKGTYLQATKRVAYNNRNFGL